MVAVKELFVAGYGDIPNQGNSEVGIEWVVANVERGLSNFSW